MNQKQKSAETRYRLAVVVLDELLHNGIINETEYDESRVRLAKRTKAPIGLLESEEMLWKKENNTNPICTTTR